MDHFTPGIGRICLWCAKYFYFVLLKCTDKYVEGKNTAKNVEASLICEGT